MRRAGGYDARTVGMQVHGSASPESSLKDVCARCVEKPVKWSLTGPRTCKWCVNYLVVEGLGIEGHHERFRQLCRIESGSWGVQEHFQLSMVRIRLQREGKEAESKAIAGRLSLQKQQTFGGYPPRIYIDGLPRAS